MGLAILDFQREGSRTRGYNVVSRHGDGMG